MLLLDQDSVTFLLFYISISEVKILINTNIKKKERNVIKNERASIMFIETMHRII